MNYKICKTEGCGKLANRVSYGLCEACYGRLRRRGTTEYRKPKCKYLHSGGYIIIRSPSHPLCNKHNTNYEYEHRIIYYNHYGEGPFNCNWCNKMITWDDLHIDHLDDNKTNNIISNLVTSCPVCNQKRGRDKMIATTREKQATKITYNGVTKTLLEWANDIDIGRTALKWRLDMGWSLDIALTEPRGKTGPQRKTNRC